MVFYIIAFILLWSLRFVPRKQWTRNEELTFAVIYPLIMLGMAFLWNVWARHLIGWPEVDSLQEFVLAILVF